MRYRLANRYSYQFENQSGYLDHALATKEMNNYISGTTIWHINADEPTVLDYNVEIQVGRAASASMWERPIVRPITIR